MSDTCSTCGGTGRLVPLFAPDIPCPVCTELPRFALKSYRNGWSLIDRETGETLATGLSYKAAEKRRQRLEEKEGRGVETPAALPDDTYQGRR